MWQHCILAYVGWLVFGIFTGFHWIAFFPGACFNPAPGYPYFRKVSVIINMVSYWVILGAFWIFRQTMLPWYKDCKGGETMSVSCLFDEQETRYAAFYVIHLLLLLAMIFKWIIDGAGLWYWIRRVHALSVHPEMKNGGESQPITNSVGSGQKF